MTSKVINFYIGKNVQGIQKESENLSIYFRNLTTKPDRIVPISVIWDAYFAWVQPYRFRYIKSPLYEIPLYAMCNV